MNTWPPRTRDLSRHQAAVVLLLLATAVSLLRWRFLDVPLERDEGEYAYFGQIILRGGLPYRDAYNMKPPGIYYGHALALWLYGETIRGVRLAVSTVAVINLWLFYRCARHWFPRAPALAGAAALAVLCANHRMLGFAAKAEHYVLLFGLAGLGLGLSAVQRGYSHRWLLAGLACGIATTMKPTGAMFAAYLAWCSISSAATRAPGEALRALFLLGGGFALPWAIVFGGFWAASALEALWFWTITYARQYATAVPFGEGIRLATTTVAHVFGGAPLAWSFAAGAWCALGHPRLRQTAKGLWPFLLTNVAAVTLGWRFSEHYFLLLVPGAAIGMALAAHWLYSWRKKAIIVVVGVLVLTVLQEWSRFRGLSPEAVSRAIYGRNPFPEAVEIAAQVRNHSGPEERIAVIGSEPEIYFYAGRKAATGFVYTYPLMEAHPFALQMQEQMIREIEAAHPRFLILVHVPMSWSRRPDSPSRILEWSAAYANTHYRPYGLVEIMANGDSRSVWGEEAQFRHPAGGLFVSVFERKP